MDVYTSTQKDGRLAFICQLVPLVRSRLLNSKGNAATCCRSQELHERLLNSALQLVQFKLTRTLWSLGWIPSPVLWRRGHAY